MREVNDTGNPDGEKENYVPRVSCVGSLEFVSRPARVTANNTSSWTQHRAVAITDELLPMTLD
jgi:hypothetical protein